jgi:hypothetical protein
VVEFIGRVASLLNVAECQVILLVLVYGKWADLIVTNLVVGFVGKKVLESCLHWYDQGNVGVR